MADRSSNRPSKEWLRRDRPSKDRPLHWAWLGRQPYDRIFVLQEELRRRVHSDEGGEHLLLLEHDPVFTLGRNASADDIVADTSWLQRQGIAVHQSNRGGQVTYHGPGQLVGYAILNLNPDRRDIGRYVQDLLEVLIRTLADHGIGAGQRPGKENIGVWVEQAKIASLGVHLSRWISIHGFALNVHTDLSHFGGIVACGLNDVVMTSMDQSLPSGQVDLPQLPDLAAQVAQHMADVFERQLLPANANELLALAEVRAEAR